MVLVEYVSGFKEKYFMEDIFEQGHYIEISMDTFNDLVVNYREQYNFSYNGDERIFTDKNTGLNFKIVRC